PGDQTQAIAVKQKRGQLHKPAGGFEPPKNHQGGQKPTFERKSGLNSIITTVSNKAIRASLLTSPGGLAAPNSSRATSSNATNELGGSLLRINGVCWVIQQIQYKLGLLSDLADNPVSTQFSSSKLSPVLQSSTDPRATSQPVPQINATSPTDVMRHHLQEDDPDPTPNQKILLKKNPKPVKNPTMPAVSNHSIGSRSDQQPLNQEYSPAVFNSPTQKQVQFVKQPQPQIIEQDIINRQSATSNPQMKPDEPNPDPRNAPSHELGSQSHNPSPENFLFTQSKILGTLSPVTKNAFSTPKVPVTKGWTTGAHQRATSSCFQGRPDEWYKNHFPPIKKIADNVK
ncbi:hypothetical protein DSO57_1010135, partial [Entomophthora muscae]